MYSRVDAALHKIRDTSEVRTVLLGFLFYTYYLFDKR